MLVYTVLCDVDSSDQIHFVDGRGGHMVLQTAMSNALIEEERVCQLFPPAALLQLILADITCSMRPEPFCC